MKVISYLLNTDGRPIGQQPGCEANALLSNTSTTLHPFNNPFSSTTWVSRYQKGKTSLDLNEARDDGASGMQWQQLDYMQTICTSLQTDNHINIPSLSFYRLDAPPDDQPTVSKHWRLLVTPANRVRCLVKEAAVDDWITTRHCLAVMCLNLEDTTLRCRRDRSSHLDSCAGTAGGNPPHSRTPTPALSQ